VQPSLIYLRILATSDARIWKSVRYVVAGIVVAQLLITVTYLLVAVLPPMAVFPLLALFWVHFLAPFLIPVVPAMYAAAVVGSQAHSDELDLLRLADRAPRDVVESYYLGIKEQLNTRLRVLWLASAVLFGVRFMIVVSNSPNLKLMDALFVPLLIVLGIMTVNIEMLNLMAVAAGIWAGLRFRETSTAIAVSVAAAESLLLVALLAGAASLLVPALACVFVLAGPVWIPVFAYYLNIQFRQMAQRRV
jgi:hypothetical protein